MPPFAAKLADSLYFFTGSAQEAAFFAACCTWAALVAPAVVVSAAAVATPAPRATEAPKPATRTAARVRMRAGRKERDETRWDIETSRGGDKGEPPGAQDRAVVAVPW